MKRRRSRGWAWDGRGLGQAAGWPRAWESLGSPRAAETVRLRRGGNGEGGNIDVDQDPWAILVLLLIVLVGGFFAAAEMALVSLREGQVRALSQRGKRGQRAAKLAQDPNRFLSSVQIGVTLATLLSGTFGAATLAGDLKTVFVHQGLSDGLSDALAIAAVTLAISFFTLVLGELAPKRI